MTRTEEKILKILSEYIGDEVDVDDLFYENICTSDMEMSELFSILESKTGVNFGNIPNAYDFELVNDFIQYIAQNYPV